MTGVQTCALPICSSEILGFNFSVIDADGDNINGVLNVDFTNNEVFISGIGSTDGDLVVEESNLTYGTDTDTNALTQNGTFTITALDGIKTVTIDNTELTLEELLDLNNNNVSINTAYGILLLTAFNGTSQGGEVEYSYTLNQNVDNDSQTNATNHSYTDSINVQVSDIDGNSDVSAINILINDDYPILDIISGVMPNTAGAELSGTLANIGADSAGTLTWTGVTANITTSEGTQSNVTLTSMGENVNITYSGNVIAGTTADGDIVFTIIGNDDGTYTVNQYRTLDSSKLLENDDQLFLVSGSKSAKSFILYEGSSQLVADSTPDADKEWLAQLTATKSSGGSGNIDLSSNGLGVENNVISNREKVFINLNDEKQFSAVKISMNQQYDSNDAKYIAYYTDGTNSGLQDIDVVGATKDFFIQAEDRKSVV